MENVVRDKFWDVTKALLIFFVVLGHTLELNLNDRINLALYNTIYTFHMPLFIFLSGHFSKKYNDIFSFAKSLGRIFEAYLVFQFLSILVELFFYNKYPSIFSLFSPRWTVWYLLSLFWWKCMLQISVPLIEKNYKAALSVCVCIGLIVGFIPVDYPLSFQRTFSMLPYFVLGYYAKRKNIEIKKHLSNFLFGILVLFVFFVFFFIVNENQKTILWGVYSYKMVETCAYRLLWYIVAIFLSLCFLTCVNKIKCNNNLLLYIGRNTLFIYVFHTFFIRILKYIVSHLCLPDSIVFLIFYSTLIFFVVGLLSRIKVLRMSLNPVSSFLKRRNMQLQ